MRNHRYSPEFIPYNSPKEMIKFYKYLDEMEEAKEIKRKKKDEESAKNANKPKAHTFSRAETIMILFLFAPIVGPIDYYLVISLFKNSYKLLQTLIQ